MCSWSPYLSITFAALKSKSALKFPLKFVVQYVWGAACLTDKQEAVN